MDVNKLNICGYGWFLLGEFYVLIIKWFIFFQKINYNEFGVFICVLSINCLL